MYLNMNEGEIHVSRSQVPYRAEKFASTMTKFWRIDGPAWEVEDGTFSKPMVLCEKELLNFRSSDFEIVVYVL